jgi:hypothetical protein
VFLSANQGSAGRKPSWSPGALWTPEGFWPSIIRIIVLEVTALLALATALVAYVNWSSAATFAEFLAASEIQAAQSAQINITDRKPCDRGT